jgi:hypothetical protein
MQRHQLQALSREELIVEAERAGVPRPRVLTQAELVDEILKRTTGSDRDKTRARGWLGRARDLIATVVEKGLHLPDAAAAIRNGPKGWPPPPPPLPTVTLAEIYAAQGHLERAVAVLDDVLRRESDHQEARELRERFRAQLARGPKSASEPPVSAAADTEPSRANEEPTEKSDNSADESEDPVEKSEDGSRESEAGEAAAEPRGAAAEQRGAAAEQRGAAAERSRAEPRGAAAEQREAAAGQVEQGDASPPGQEARDERDALAEGAAVEDGSGGDQAAIEDEIAAVGAEPTAAPEGEVAARAAAASVELTDAQTAAGEASAGADATPVTMPEHYDVDEVVALAVDPSTFYVYWEVRPTTFANMVAREPNGALALRVTAVTPGWEGPIIETRDVPVDALHGDHFIHHVRPRADVRVSVGWISEGRFDPIAIGAEVSAPRAFVAAGTPAPGGAPLDLSEGPHGTPEGFVRPVVFAARERAATMLAAGWLPRELAGTVIEGAADQAPEDAGDGPASWIWVPGPAADQIGMAVMFGPSTADLPGSNPEDAADPQGIEWRRDAEGGVWQRDVEGGSWRFDGGGGEWRRDTDGVVWRRDGDAGEWRIASGEGPWSWSTEGGSWSLSTGGSWSRTTGGSWSRTTGGSWGGASEGGPWGGSSEGRWGGSSEGRWGGSSEGRWGGSSGGRWGGASEGGRWGGASEGGRWGGSSEGRWGGASEGGRWGGASEGGRWGGASEGGPWGGASEGGRWARPGGSSAR